MLGRCPDCDGNLYDCSFGEAHRCECSRCKKRWWWHQIHLADDRLLAKPPDPEEPAPAPPPKDRDAPPGDWVLAGAVMSDGPEDL